MRKEIRHVTSNDSSKSSVAVEKPYRIDPAFKELLPPLASEDRQSVLESLRQHRRCLVPFYAWREKPDEKPILLDGNQRDALIDELREQGIEIEPPQIVELAFPDQAAALAYAWQINFSRRHLTPAAKALAVLQNKAMVQELKLKAKAKLGTAAKRNGSPSAHAPKADAEVIHVRKVLAQKAGVGEQTVLIAQKLLDACELKAVDNWAAMTKARWEKGDISNHEAATKIRDMQERAEQREAQNRAPIPLPPLSPELAGKVDQIHLADVLEGLKLLADESVSLVVTSPPYPLSTIFYENSRFSGSYDQYMDWLRGVFAAIHPKLRDGGRVVINIDACSAGENRDEGQCAVTPDSNGEQESPVDSSPLRNIYRDVSNFMNDIGYLFIGEIAWYKQNSVGRRPNWGSFKSCRSPRIRRNHEYVLIFAKGSPILEGDPKLCDISEKEFKAFTISHWYIPPEPRKAKDHADYHIAPYPEELVYRLVRLFSYRADVVLDPFSGSGTTSFVAKALGRRYIGIDNGPNYVASSKRRLAALDGLSPGEQLKSIKRYSVPDGQRTDGYGPVTKPPASPTSK
jgi:DNA modification methylase